MIDQAKLDAAAEKMACALWPLDEFPSLRITATFPACREVLSAVLELSEEQTWRIVNRVQEAHFRNQHNAVSPEPKDLPEGKTSNTTSRGEVTPNCPVCGKALGLVVRPGSGACVSHLAERATLLCSDDSAWYYCPNDGDCGTGHYSRGPDGQPEIRKRVKAVQDGKDILVIDFWLRGARLEMQVIEQDEGLRQRGELLRAGDLLISSWCAPALDDDALLLFGRDRQPDNWVASWIYTSPVLALAALRKWMAVIPKVRLPERVCKACGRRLPKEGAGGA